MQTATSKHRKLIDLPPSVFDALSMEASRRGLSLKRFIEKVLEEACPRPALDVAPGIRRLIGSAIPKGNSVEEIEDDRFQYLLSK